MVPSCATGAERLREALITEPLLPGEGPRAVSVLAGRWETRRGFPSSPRPLSLQRGTSPCAACAANLSDGSAPNSRVFWTREETRIHVKRGNVAILHCQTV